METLCTIFVTLSFRVIFDAAVDTWNLRTEVKAQVIPAEVFLL